MAVHGGKRISRRHRLAAVAIGLGIAAGGGHSTAWADDGPTNSGSFAGHSRTTPPNSPKNPAPAVSHRQKPSKPAASSATPKLSAVQHDSNQKIKGNPVKTAAAAPKAAAVAATTLPAPNTATVKTPAPLSPIAKILALPGRIVNTVLQMLGVTGSLHGPRSLFDWAPIDQALFGAFRGLENRLGFNRTPAKQQTPPTLTYTGPTDDKTPTVAQFFNAASGEYVLGEQPGDVKPFTVNGFQMQYFNPISGAAGRVWATSQGQLILSYQGTTGGTRLLFHPLIAIPQIISDGEVIFSRATPQAFYDSVTFERRVEAEAVKQGYSTSDIFLTGHSLGAWEAEYVAQRTGRAGIGFEAPGLNTKVPGNGANSGFVNIETYGDSASYVSTDLPGLQPFMPPYVPAGGSKPHYGSIVMLGDPREVNRLQSVSKLWGLNPINDLFMAIDVLVNFNEHHLPAIQAYNLGISPDPTEFPWYGMPAGPVRNWGGLTIGQLQKAASDAGVLIAP